MLGAGQAGAAELAGLAGQLAGEVAGQAGLAGQLGHLDQLAGQVNAGAPAVPDPPR